MSSSSSTFISSSVAPRDAPCSPRDADISWVLIATVLVLGMLPGLAFFEAGLVRGKNTISITVQVFSGAVVLSCMWIFFGFSLSFAHDSTNSFIGNLNHVLLIDISYTDCYPGTVIPSMLYCLFQMMFAAITPLLMTGAFAERLAWRPFILLMCFWELLVYYPVAHWVWHPQGWLKAMGAQDYAGGIVIHITAGVASLVSVLVLGQRQDFAKHHGDAPYSSLPVACIGATLLWTGWFGFNGGCALAAGRTAIYAVVNSQIGATVCSCCFLLFQLRKTGKPSIIAIINGAVAGLAGITPTAGFISPVAAILLAILLAFAAQVGIFVLKHRLMIDDALDVSSVHGITGFVGALFIGIAGDASIGGANGVVFGGSARLLGVQLLACVVCAAWSAVWTFAILKVISFFFVLRVDEAVEKGGLDLLENGEVAWLVEKVTPNTSFAIVPLRTTSRIEDDHEESLATLPGEPLEKKRASKHDSTTDDRGDASRQRSSLRRKSIKENQAFNEAVLERAILVVGSEEAQRNRTLQ